MTHSQHSLTFKAPKQGLLEITDEIARWVEHQSVTTGLLTLFLRHTSASILIQENADPDVLSDLSAFLDRMVPDGDPQYRHSAEGDDDMPAHIRSALTQTQVSIPLVGGQLALGTWQDIYLFEHRTAPYRRQVVLHLSGE